MVDVEFLLQFGNLYLLHVQDLIGIEKKNTCFECKINAYIINKFMINNFCLYSFDVYRGLWDDDILL